MNPRNPSATIVRTPKDLGALGRKRRQMLHLGLRKAAPTAGVGPRFLSEFERGKPSVELGKVLGTLHALGLEVMVAPRESKEESSHWQGGYAARLGMEFPYDWSNQNMETGVFLRKVLQTGRFSDILAAVGHFGLEGVSQRISELKRPEEIERATEILVRIYRGMLLARAGKHRSSPVGIATELRGADPEPP